MKTASPASATARRSPDTDGATVPVPTQQGNRNGGNSHSYSHNNSSSSYNHNSSSMKKRHPIRRMLNRLRPKNRSGPAAVAAQHRRPKSRVPSAVGRIAAAPVGPDASTAPVSADAQSHPFFVEKQPPAPGPDSLSYDTDVSEPSTGLDSVRSVSDHAPANANAVADDGNRTDSAATAAPVPVDCNDTRDDASSLRRPSAVREHPERRQPLSQTALPTVAVRRSCLVAPDTGRHDKRVRFPTEPNDVLNAHEVCHRMTEQEAAQYWYSKAEIVACRDDAVAEAGTYMDHRNDPRSQASPCVRGLECLVSNKLYRKQLQEVATLRQALRRESARQVRIGNYPDIDGFAKACRRLTPKSVQRALDTAKTDAREAFSHAAGTIALVSPRVVSSTSSLPSLLSQSSLTSRPSASNIHTQSKRKSKRVQALRKRIQNKRTLSWSK